MLVVGGRTRWARVVSRCCGWGAALLLGGSGCGGRTSTLDQEVYVGEGPLPTAGQSSSGGSAGQGGAAVKGGAPAFPTAGSTSMPTAGQPNVPADAVSKACQNYCSGYAVKCPAQLMGQNCMQACQQEMSGFGDRCQTLGLRALKCLTPFFKKGEPSCEGAIGSALAKCSPQVQRFQECKGVDEPVPQPQPQPGVISQCPAVGEVGPEYCRISYSCPVGVYSVDCGYFGGMGGAPGSPGSIYNCSCYRPDGSGQGFTVGASMLAPCEQAAATCGFTPVLK